MFCHSYVLLVTIIFLFLVIFVIFVLLLIWGPLLGARTLPFAFLSFVPVISEDCKALENLNWLVRTVRTLRMMDEWSAWKAARILLAHLNEVTCIGYMIYDI